MRNDTWIEELPTELTESERADRGRQMARARVELDDHEVHAAETKRSLKSKADTISTKIGELARAVDTGKEKRAIECYERPDVRRFQIDVIRMDTGEVVRSRPMDKREREDATQGSLFEREPEDLQAQRTARAAVGEAARQADDQPKRRSRKPKPAPVAEATVVEGDRTSPMERRRHALAAAEAEGNVVELDDDEPGTIDNPQPLPQPIPPAE